MRYYRTFPLARLAQLRQAQFPPLLRALLILANGSNSLTDLARIVHRPVADLSLPLMMLREMQMVDARPPYQRRPIHASAGYAATHHYGSKLVGRQTRELRAA